MYDNMFHLWVVWGREYYEYSVFSSVIFFFHKEIGLWKKNINVSIKYDFFLYFIDTFIFFLEYIERKKKEMKNI